MVSATIDFQEFTDLLPRLEKALNGGIIKAVNSQARLLVRNDNAPSLVSLTPPRGLDAGKDVGEWAVARDLKRVFVSSGVINSILARSRKKAAFSRYVKQGKLEEAKKLLNGQTEGSVQVAGYSRNGKQVKGYTQKRQVSNLGDNRLGNITEISDRPNPAIHKARRGQRYKVGRKQWSQVVLKGKQLDVYQKDVQKRVGSMKAGWRFAAQALDVSLPPYVNNATSKTNGYYRAQSPGPASYTLEMGNTTPRIDRLLTQRTVDFLVGLRLQNLEAFLEKSAQAAAASVK
jgi:hypothetical protein